MPLFISSLSFSWPAPHPDLHSFPTRRSSDLPIPQADSRVKNRPAIILREMPSYGDLLVCGVSTQLHHYLQDRKSTRLNSSHVSISYAVFCLKKKIKRTNDHFAQQFLCSIIYS